jgi:hypothetical protein
LTPLARELFEEEGGALGKLCDIDLEIPMETRRVPGTRH